MVASAIHSMSPRRHERFIGVDCGTLSVSLLESELFGHLKGSFTGAVADKRGIFEAAHRGAVFLDEICNVDVEVQSKLLRFIQEREFLTVGGTETRNVDVRLIFATNRDLEKMVNEGTFREDLYYRLYVFPIYLPPLRERREDIALLAYHLLTHVRERSGKNVSSFSEDALRLLEQFDWPGNVRQLERTVERAAITCDGSVIESRHLPQRITRQGLGGRLPDSEDKPRVCQSEEKASRAVGRGPGAGICPRSPATQRLECKPRRTRGRHSKAQLPGIDAKTRHPPRRARLRCILSLFDCIEYPCGCTRPLERSGMTCSLGAFPWI